MTSREPMPAAPATLHRLPAAPLAALRGALLEAAATLADAALALDDTGQATAGDLMREASRLAGQAAELEATTIGGARRWGALLDESLMLAARRLAPVRPGAAECCRIAARRIRAAVALT